VAEWQQQVWTMQRKGEESREEGMNALRLGNLHTLHGEH